MSAQDRPSDGAVLIVDDVPANLLALEAVLGPLGIRTVRAESGPEALARASEEQFALVLLDVQMPDMDGFEVAKRLRDTERGRATPIIFLTAIHREVQYAKAGYDLGAADYFVKPFDPEILRARVRSFVDLHNRREELRREQVSARTRERDEAMRQLVAFERIATAALKSTDLDAFLRALLDVFVDAVDPVDCAVILLREGESLTARASIGLDDETASCFDAAMGQGFAGTIAATHEARQVTSESEAKAILSDVWIRARGVRGLLGVPLVSEGEVCGVAIIGSVGPADFSDSERRLFAAVAARAAAAVDRVRSWKRVEQSEARYRSLIDAASAAVWIENDTARPEPSTSWTALTGQNAEDRKRWGWTAALHPEDVHGARRAWAAGLESGALFEHDCRIRRADGSHRWFVVRAAQVDGVAGIGGSPAREWVFAAIDIDDRKTTELENAELYQRAQDAIRIREEFLSIASHELRTPLTPLKLHLGIMRKHPPKEPHVLIERLAFIDRQVDKMNGLVSQLLDVSRIAGGRLELQPEWLDLYELAERIVERFATNEPGSVLRLHGSELRAYLDPLRIEQLITNLVTNAIKYGGGKPIDIEIAADGEGARIVVRDRGIGIEQTEQARIFGRFERAAPANQYGGFGLGLWIAQRVVEASGGRIAVTSAPGEGSEFMVRLPLRSDESNGVLQAASASKAS